MSIHDPQVIRTVETPCCAAEVTVTATEFVHRGRPRRTDTSVEVWNLRCPVCDAPHQVAIEQRLKARRAECATTYETRRRLVGAPIWTVR